MRSSNVTGIKCCPPLAEPLPEMPWVTSAKRTLHLALLALQPVYTAWWGTLTKVPKLVLGYTTIVCSHDLCHLSDKNSKCPVSQLLAFMLNFRQIKKS